MNAETEATQARINALGIIHRAWEKDRALSPEDVTTLKAQGLSEEDVNNFWYSYMRSVSVKTERKGGYTELPQLRPDEKRDLVGGDLAGFVEDYISWASLPDEERLQPDAQKLQWFLDIGKGFLGNTPQETKRLLSWMQEHFEDTADFLERAWSYGRLHTERFRYLMGLGMLPKLNIPPDEDPIP